MIFDLLDKLWLLKPGFLPRGRGACLLTKPFSPTYYKDFYRDPTLPTGATFTRATTATQTDHDGVLNQAVAGEARFDGLRRVRNQVRNAGGYGSAAGSPGTLPTNWLSSDGGCTRTISVSAAPAGFYIDIRWNGTTNAASCTLGMESTTQIAAVAGQNWVTSCQVALQAGSLTNVTAVNLRITERTSGGATLVSSTQTMNLTGSLQRFAVPRTTNNASTAFISPAIDVSTSVGVAIDITLRIWCPQIENVTGALNLLPGDQIVTGGSAPYQGAGVDGVQYFNTRNGIVTQQNLSIQSQDFTNVAWAVTDNTKTGGQTDSQSGTTACLFTEGTAGTAGVTGTTGTNGITQSVNTISIDLKRGNTDWLRLRFITSGSDAVNSWVNLNTGQFGSTTLVGGANLISKSVISLGSGWYRFSLTASSLVATPGINFFSAGGDLNFGRVNNATYYAGRPQINAGEATCTYLPTTTVAVGTGILESYAGTGIDKLLTFKGLLGEEARTNSIRNNTGSGAAAGSPGTLPTNWTYPATPGLSTQVVASGSVAGIAYTDVRLFGTTSSSAASVLKFETVTGVAAVNGQSWTESLYIAVVGGSQTNISNVSITADAFDGSSTYLGHGINSLITVSNVLTRNSASGTIGFGTTAYLQPCIYVQVSGSGVAVDITLRIGLPQLELGAFATSPIPTTSAAVTRNQDTCTAPISSVSGFNLNQGALMAEFIPGSPITATTGQTALSLDDGSLNNRVSLGRGATSGLAIYRVLTGGTVYNSGNGLTLAQGVLSRMAVSYGQQLSTGAQNGGTLTKGTGAVSLSGITTLALGQGSGALGPMNGWLRKVGYAPQAANQSQLQAVVNGAWG